MKTSKTVLAFVLGLLCAALVTIAPGCGGTREAATAERDKLVEQRGKIADALIVIDQQAAALPVGDPLRVTLEEQSARGRAALVKVDAAIAEFDAGLAKADKEQASIETWTATARQFEGWIPEPFRSLLFGAAGLGTAGLAAVRYANLYKRVRQAAKEIVQSMELTMPDEPFNDPNVLAVINAIQSVEAKALVDAAQKELKARQAA